MSKSDILKHNIRFIRKYVKMSQDDFGTAIGSNGDKVYTYEKRGTEPDVLVVEKLLKLAKVDEETFRSIKLTTENYEQILKGKKTAPNKLTVVNEAEAEYGEKGMMSLMVQLLQRQNHILERQTVNVEDKVENIDVNLNAALNQIDSLKVDVVSQGTVVMKSLARLEGKAEGALIKESDSIVISLLDRQKKHSKRSVKDKQSK